MLKVKTPNLPFLLSLRPKSWTGACVCWLTVFVFLTSVFLCLMFYHLLFTVCSSCYVFPSLCPAFYVSFHEKLAEFTCHGRGSINKKLLLPSPNYHCCWVYFFSVNIAVRVGRPFFPTIGIGPCCDTSFFIFCFLNLVRTLSCQLFFSPSKKKMQREAQQLRHSNRNPPPFMFSARRSLSAQPYGFPGACISFPRSAALCGIQV